MASFNFVMQKWKSTPVQTSSPHLPALLWHSAVRIRWGAFPSQLSGKTHSLWQKPPSAQHETVILRSWGPWSQRWSIRVQVRLITENCSTDCCALVGWEGFWRLQWWFLYDMTLQPPRVFSGKFTHNTYRRQSFTGTAWKPTAHPLSLLLALIHVHVIVHMRNTDRNCLNVKNWNWANDF